MERTTHRTTAAEDNNGSAPPTAGQGISLPASQAAVKKGVKNQHRSRSRSESERMAYARDFLTNNPPTTYLFDGHVCPLWSDIDKIRRRGCTTEEFREEYTYATVIDGCIRNERKSCIWQGDTFSWQDESSGTMWVGVHGADSICVVTRSGDLEVTHLRGSLDHRPMHRIFFKFRNSLIVEIEDPSIKVRLKFHQRIEKPFSVVSVIPDTRHADAASCVENGEIKAIKFLQEKMFSDTIFTVNETIQTAISAFQHLFQKRFEPDEIQVSLMDPNCFKDKDPPVEELNIHQIKEHLDVINKCGPPSHKEKPEPCPEDSSSGSSGLLERKLQAARERRVLNERKLVWGGR